MLYSPDATARISRLAKRLRDDTRSQAGFSADTPYHPAMALLSRNNFIKECPPPLGQSRVVRSDTIQWHYGLLCSDAQVPSYQIAHLPHDAGSITALESRADHVNKSADQFNDALQCLHQFAPASYEKFCALVTEVLPLETIEGGLLSGSATGRGLSSAHYLGGIFLAPPQGGTRDENLFQLMLNLIHEAGHQLLFLLQSADPLVLDPRMKVYSPVRRVDRPVLRSMHACSASVMMIEFCAEIVRNGAWSPDSLRLAAKHSEAQSLGLRVSLKALAEVGLTDMGKNACRQWVEYAA